MIIYLGSLVVYSLKKIYRVFLLITIFEIFVIIIEYFDINILVNIINYFWNIEKFILSGRIEGTFLSPNTLGIILIILTRM